MRMSSRALLASVLLVVSMPTSVAQTFVDVQGTRYQDAFSYLSQTGAVQGFDGDFARPYQYLTRVEALRMVVDAEPTLHARQEWFRTHMPPLPLFEDVDQRAWYAPYLEAGFEQGLVTADRDYLYHGNAPVHAEEGIAMLLRAFKDESASVEGSPWYLPTVTRAFQLNLVSPVEHIRLGDLLSRGQFADMIYRLAVVRQQGLVSFQEPSAVAPTPAPAPQVSEQVIVPQPAQEPVPVVVRPKAPVEVPVMPVQPQPAPVVVPAPVVTPPAPAPAPVTPASVPPASETPTENAFSITIPALGIENLTVTHPTDPTTSEGLLAPLQKGVGHLFGYPGGQSKVLIYGHSSGYPWDVSQYTKIFRTINKLQEGDRITIHFHGKQYVYAVTSKDTIPAGDMTGLSGEGPELLLYTCWPPDSIKQRYIVHAVPVQE